MARQGRELELLIKKIKFLKTVGAEILSPEYVADIDTGHLREVDVGIRFQTEKGPIFIAIECRDRGKRQDIQWIEQLIAKKISVSADILIAVSSLSFTKQAKEKAFKNGIIIRNIDNIKPEDILTLKEIAYIQVCYVSDINIDINELLLVDIKTKMQCHLQMAKIQNCLIYDKLIGKTFKFEEAKQMFITSSAHIIRQKAQNVFDKQNYLNEIINVPCQNISLIPYNYDIKAANFTITAKKEQIKYPLSSVIQYKNSVNSDLLAEIYQYNIDCLNINNLIVDKDTNTSMWEVDLAILQKPNKIFSNIMINEQSAILKKLVIKN